jgi:hypothetical protein
MRRIFFREPNVAISVVLAGDSASVSVPCLIVVPSVSALIFVPG